jgi:hypothetical protein
MAVSLLLVATLLLSRPVKAQTFQVLHAFTGGIDGAHPYHGLTLDRAGNLYGTAYQGGSQANDCSNWGGCGTVFKLTRSGSSWVCSPLYQFLGFPTGDGSGPYGRVIFGPDGSLYGTTASGGLTGSGCGGEIGCGTVFKLNPPATVCKTVVCPWTESRIYSFTGAPDGASPTGEIVFNTSGNLVGATGGGGTHTGGGTVFQLTPSNGGWQETVLYSFSNGLDGGDPIGGVVLDSAGNIHGTTWLGGAGDFGTAFQLAYSGGSWTLTTMYTFGIGNNGFGSYAPGIFDAAGNYYNATVNGNPNGNAYVFELNPYPGGWTYNTVYTMPQCYGCGPAGNLVMDASGNLYGTTRGDGGTGDPYGNVFKLTPSSQGWIYTDLYDFTGGNDGNSPYSNVTIDAEGNLYGTTTGGGQYGNGVVWEITP